MGQRGDKHTSKAELGLSSLLKKLSNIDGIASKKMFGGYGIFHDGKMFALVNSSCETHLKVDDTLKGKFEKAGSVQHGKMPYFSIPQDIMDDSEALVNWAEESIDIAKD